LRRFPLRFHHQFSMHLNHFRTLSGALAMLLLANPGRLRARLRTSAGNPDIPIRRHVGPSGNDQRWRNSAHCRAEIE
jgi:hypothetical protein